MKHTSEKPDIRSRLLHLIEHFEHVLPGQAPIQDFVHHNTLHGFEHLAFPDALKAVHELTGAYGYEPVQKYREYYQQGRILEKELKAVIDADTALEARQQITADLARGDVYLQAMLYPLNAVTACQLNWQIEEQHALTSFQPDISQHSRDRLLAASGCSEAEAITGLWEACMQVLEIDQQFLHPEELADMSAEYAEELLTTLAESEQVESVDNLLLHRLVHKESDHLQEQLWRQVGDEITLRGLLKMLTGHDVMDDYRPALQRHLASYLDQGVAAWRNGDSAGGFFHAWRESAMEDMVQYDTRMPDWQDQLQLVPDDPLEAVIVELRQLGLEQTAWEGYLQRLALELPGWSGMFLWRHLHPGYDGQPAAVNMMDYLAVRLVLERLYAQRLTRRTWHIEASLPTIHWYFHHRRSEFFVRYTLFNKRLPEFLSNRAQRLAEQDSRLDEDYTPWKIVADMIWNWQQSPSSDHPDRKTPYRHGWQLFRLAQGLGMDAQRVQLLEREQIAVILDCLQRLDEDKAGFVWLQAYEINYRDQFLNAICNNYLRGRWKSRKQRPQAQLIFCMDDREEGIRRHLESLNPQLETLGAAAFYNTVINWKGLDDDKLTPLCPVVRTPSHELDEIPRTNASELYQQHRERHHKRILVKNLLGQEVRRNLLSSSLAIVVSAPAALAVLVGKIATPLQFGRLSESLRRNIDLEVPTTLALTADASQPEGTVECNRRGFSDQEQAANVGQFLRTIGLAQDFSPFVVLFGHGSSSENNPHASAYNCGACSGNHSGPNARAFAQMANRPQVRDLLREQEIHIPDDVRFVGAYHNTGSEQIEWFDLDMMPESSRLQFEPLRSEVAQAAELSAHERCRKFASAPKRPTIARAVSHIAGRSVDFSQARPELGHATNASAVIGRRSVTQGLFLDRRTFLISYDPTTDADGAIIEQLLLSNGPVGAGISLEYYFSSVNNEQFGCGTKVMHNVTGFFGVMEGANSDLRTGLPRQMIEIHEAMRLHVLVEASVEVLTKVYQRQPPLQQLIGNGWLLVSAIDPDTGEISLFDPRHGFIPWDGEVKPLQTVDQSSEWYEGHMQPLQPVMLKQEAAHA